MTNAIQFCRDLRVSIPKKIACFKLLTIPRAALVSKRGPCPMSSVDCLGVEVFVM
jgi:hypothetical protein